MGFFKSNSRLVLRLWSRTTTTTTTITATNSSKSSNRTSSYVYDNVMKWMISHRCTTMLRTNPYYNYHQHCSLLLCRNYHELSFQSSGEPKDVVQYRQCMDDHVEEHGASSSTTTTTTVPHVRISMIGVPWNPADKNTIQGKYPSAYDSASANRQHNNDEQHEVQQQQMLHHYKSIRKSHYFPGHTVIGSEGLGYVTEIYNNNNNNNDNNDNLPVKVGDYVAVALPGFGTYRSSFVVPINGIIPIERGNELIQYQQKQQKQNFMDPSEKINNNNVTTSNMVHLAPLFQLGGTALRMINDDISLSQLRDGDVIIQNAGNSGVGFYVSQLVAAGFVTMGSTRKNNHNHHNNEKIGTSTTTTTTISTERKKRHVVVSLIRRGTRTLEQYETLRQYLVEVGRNDIVIAEEDLYNNPGAIRTLQDEIRTLSNNILQSTCSSSGPRQISSSSSSPIQLALNGVGGESAQLLLKLLGPGGTMITYGGMSQQPVTVPTPYFIFKNVHLKGYWHSRWLVENTLNKTQSSITTTTTETAMYPDLRYSMINELVNLLLDGKLVNVPTEVFPLSAFNEALQFENEQNSVAIRKKIVFDCRE